MRWREAGKNRAHVCGSKADARLFDAEITRRQRMGDLATLDAGKVTLATFARETWWPQHVHPNLERATRESYAGTWDRHIGPELGGYPLRELTAPIVRRWLDNLIAQGVGRQAVRRAKAILQSCLARAVEAGLLQGNPAQAVRPPKLEQQPRVQAIGPGQVEALRAALSSRDATLVAAVLA